MRIRDNIRTMLSTTAGIAGGGVALAGWLVKAITPTNASAATKTVVGLTTGALIGGVTYGTLTVMTPATLTLLGLDISVYTSAIGSGLLALYTGACTSTSYFLGGGASSGGGNTKGAAKSRVARETAKILEADIPNFLK